MSDEKTEEPTDKKLRDAREDGQTVSSQDVNTAASFMLATLCLVASSTLAGDHLRKLFDMIDHRMWTLRSDTEMLALAFEMAREGIMMTLPYVAGAVAVGFIASVSQAGMQVSFEPVTPKFEKINPADGLKKLFSIRPVIDFLKMVVKAVLLGAVVWVIISGLMPLLIGSSTQETSTIAEIAWASFVKLFGAATVVFIVIGPVDWGIQKWLFIRDQRMSKDEVKREHKEQEGDPLIKSKRRQFAMELLNSAGPPKVQRATVVVNNPTHFSVALRYKPGETPLPVVLVTGQDEAALRIRQEAQEHGIPMVTNPPLARALHRLPPDTFVPEELFEAVAAVLRWVALVDQLSSGLTETAADRPPGGGH
jgi:type III secretion protein U